MSRHWPQYRTTSLLAMGLVLGTLQGISQAQPPAKKQRVQKQRVQKDKGRKEHAQKGRVSPPRARAEPAGKTRAPRARRGKSYVRARRDYGHVRVPRRVRRVDGAPSARPVLIRSARVTPAVLRRFEGRRHEQIQLTIRHLREGRRAKALESWGSFIESLVDYGEPIDLDDVMLYVAREGCPYENPEFLFYAGRLAHLQECEERTEDYIDQLHDQRDVCMRGGHTCSTTTLQNLQAEVVRARADLEIFGIETRVAREQLERAIEPARDYESRFGVVYDDLYREVELRIRFSP